MAPATSVTVMAPLVARITCLVDNGQPRHGKAGQLIEPNGAVVRGIRGHKSLPEECSDNESKERLEAGDLKMMVVREGVGDSQSSHDRKRNVIDNAGIACLPGDIGIPGQGPVILGRKGDFASLLQPLSQDVDFQPIGPSCGRIAAFGEPDRVEEDRTHGWCSLCRAATSCSPELNRLFKMAYTSSRLASSAAGSTDRTSKHTWQCSGKSTGSTGRKTPFSKMAENVFVMPGHSLWNLKQEH
jgi:hypothetical protein